MIATLQEKEHSPKECEFVTGLLSIHSDIRLGLDKLAMVSGRLAKRLRQLGLGAFEKPRADVHEADKPGTSRRESC